MNKRTLAVHSFIGSLFLSIVLSAMNAHAQQAAPLASPRFPDNALPVPLVVQATEYSCGAAALLSALYYWKAYDGVETALYDKLDTTKKDGTEPEKIAEVAASFGLSAQVKRQMSIEDLRQHLVLGDTVILDLQSGPNTGSWQSDWENGHYDVLVGMDRNYAYVMDPSQQAAYVYVPLPELMERWHDYENRHGYVQRNLQLGIVLHGERALKAFPGRLVRM